MKARIAQLPSAALEVTSAEAAPLLERTGLEHQWNDGGAYDGDSCGAAFSSALISNALRSK